jgi:hypothetical protein
VGSAAKKHDLQAGGRIVLQMADGLTNIAGEGGVAGAWVVGIDTPYYAVTDDRGRYRIDELAAGTYDITIIQPPVMMKDGASPSRRPAVMHRRVTVDGKRPSRLDVTLQAPQR